MNPLWLPGLCQLRNRARHASSEDYRRFALFVLLAILLLGGIYQLLLGVFGYFSSTEIIGTMLTKRLLSIIFLVFFIMQLVSAAVSTLGVFYTATDLPLIMTLPLHPTTIFRARAAQCYINSTWTLYLILFTVFMAFGKVYQAHPLFYLVLPLMLGCFTLIPVLLGITASMTIVQMLSSSRTKRLLYPLLFLGGVSLLVLLRLSRPEQLADPAAYLGISRYLYDLELPVLSFLPNSWATEVIIALLRNHFNPLIALRFLYILGANAAFLFIIAEVWAEKVYIPGWQKSLAGDSSYASKRGSEGLFLRLYLKLFPLNIRHLIKKDLKVFFRDSAQWSQLFLLAALVVVYIFNYSSLPLDTTPLPTIYMENLVSFINIGITGFILAALATRFFFPAISTEGQAFWLLKTAPISLQTFLTAKLYLAFWPLLFVGMLLITTTSYLLSSSLLITIVSLIVELVIVYGVATISVCTGAIYPDFRSSNYAQASSSYGGTVCMITTAIYVGSCVSLAAWPTYMIFVAQQNQFALSPLVTMLVTLAYLLPLLLTAALSRRLRSLAQKQLETECPI